MLPDGFAWEQNSGHNMTLTLNEKAVALLVALEPGYGFRLDINPDKRNRRSHFVKSKDAATAYLEAWANKWQEQLRAAY